MKMDRCVIYSKQTKLNKRKIYEKKNKRKTHEKKIIFKMKPLS